jgi:transposase
VIWIGHGRTYETLQQFIVWVWRGAVSGAGKHLLRHVGSLSESNQEEYLGEDGIMFDKFHIKKHLNDAVDLVRKQEYLALKANGIQLLTKTKYIWLKNPCNLTEYQEKTFQELKQQNLKIFKAYQQKELFNYFWSYVSRIWAEKFFTSWCLSVARSRLQPMIKAANMLKLYWYGIVSYITTPLTNARSEGLNCKIRAFTKKLTDIKPFKR